jgi:hypothetical protein
MAALKSIEIKESISTLKSLRKEYGYAIQKRLSMLIELKKSKVGGSF